MASTKSLSFKIITRIALVIALALAIIFIPNLRIFDESFLPEITERLNKEVNPNVEGNAIYSLYGVTAASEKDPHAVGKAVIETLQTKHAKGELAQLTDQETSVLFGNEKWDAPWEAAYLASNCKARTNPSCFGELLAEIKEKPFTDPRLIAQLERYSNIIQLPHFIEETRLLDYASPIPSYNVIMQTGSLSQANAYQTLGLNGFIANTQADMSFWRMALSESQTMIGRMVAIAGLRRNLTAISYVLVKEPALNSAQIQTLQILLKPLTPAEVNLERVLISELRLNAENLPATAPEGESTILWALTQHRATTNLGYRQTFKPAFAFSQMSPTEFYERAQEPAKIPPFSHFNPYNLGGKIYLSKHWQYTPYIGRAHDLAGIYTLVGLQLELKINSPEDLATAIKTSIHKNRYTNKPFDYDSTNRAISFLCFDAKDVCKITL